jgi:hypothetical protein
VCFFDEGSPTGAFLFYILSLHLPQLCKPHVTMAIQPASQAAKATS